MKKVLVFALIAVFALSLSSCGKKKEKTNTEKLCVEKGWVLSSVTAAPYYVTIDGDHITNFSKDVLKDWELDDIIVFTTSNIQTIKPGAKVPEGEERGYVADKAWSSWTFSNNEGSLNFQIPFFYDYSDGIGRTFDPEVETATITTLSETQLVLTYTYNVTDEPTKESCTLTLTYVPAK